MKLRENLRKNRIKKEKTFGNDWYDLFEDWSLIESSFASQYGIRLRSEDDMSYAEFCTLLNGIMPKTPLGNIVSIRSEENEERLKSFTPEQKRIRDEWRIKLMDKQHKENENLSLEEQQAMVKKVQDMMAKAFGKQ